MRAPFKAIAQLVILTIVSASATAVSAQDCALERPVNEQRSVLPNNKIFDIAIGGSTRKLLLHWDDVVEDDNISPDEIPNTVSQLVDKIESTLNNFSTVGFRQLPGESKCAESNVITVYLYETVGSNNPGGNASGTSVLDLRYSAASKRRGTIMADLTATVIHELFHNTQSTYRLGNAERWLIEGTASFSPELFDAQIDQMNSTGRTCENQLLASPGMNIARRHSPWRDGSNACQSKLFWNYFTEQIGTLSAEPQAGVDALVDLFEALENQPRSWRIASDDKILGAGDFDGDGRDEFLLKSETHLGLLAVTYGERRVLDVRTTDGHGRLGENGWVPHRDDEVLGIGDLNGDGRDEFVIRSATHIGFIGSTSDGRFRTIAVVPHDVGRFGGAWRSKASDRVLSIGDLNGDSREELLVASDSHIGSIGLNETNATQTVSAHLRSVPLDEGRHFREPSFVSAKGDFNNDGRDEFIVQDQEGLYLLGMDSSNRLQIHDSVSLGDRVGTGWRLANTDLVLGIGDLNAAVASRNYGDEIIIRSPRYIGILGMNTRNKLETKRVFLTGNTDPVNTLFGDEFRVVHVGGLDEEEGAEILLQRNDNFALLKIMDSNWNIEEIDSRSIAANDPLVDVSVVGRMNGGLQGNILYRDRSGWRTFGYYTDIGLFYESYTSVGEYFYSLDHKLDLFIRSKTNGDRGMEDLWRDFSAAIYVKDMNLRDLSSAYYFQDERNDPFSHDYDNNPETPPVSVFASISPGEDNGPLTVVGERWSSSYFKVEANNSDRQSVSVEISSNHERQSKMFSTFLISNVDSLISLESITFDSNNGLSRQIELEAGEELGVVVPSTYGSGEYTVHLSSKEH